MKTKSKVGAVALIALSYAFSSFAMMVVAGVWSSSFSTIDSAGRAMGFNDPL
jgi:hypothetical protein